MPRLALVRGPQMSPYEMQTFVPLLKRGWDVTAFTSEAPLNEAPPDLAVVKLPSPWDGVTRSSGLLRRVREAYAYKTGTISRLDGLEERLRGFDVLHAMETYHAFTGQALDAAHAQGKPLVVTVWENIPFFPVEAPLARVRHRVLREADAFVAVTERTRNALLVEGAPAERVHVIPVGIDLSRFAPAPGPSALRARLAIPEGAPTLLFAARLVWEKGLMDVLHAMKLNALRGHDRPHLIVAGVGPQRAEAEERARALGLASRVHFIGQTPYAQMHEVFQAADALVLGSIATPRWQEQYGMVLVEAMACGKLVVAGASGSIPDVVADAGILVQPGDPTAMAEALLQAEDAGVRASYGKKALERARTTYDRERVATAMDALYRRLA